MSELTGSDLLDLAARRLGGMVLAASDEFFAAKEHLLEPRPPVYDLHRYTDRGKEMDGWESRRKRGEGSDWVLVRLGVGGIVRALTVDTTFFRGNFPAACSLQGCDLPGFPDADALLAGGVEWVELLGRTELAGDTLQTFPVSGDQRVTHVRFLIHPDGGVARLRVHGEPLPDLRRSARGGAAIDLAASAHGAAVSGCSDRFFSAPANLLAVGDSRDMSDGWETRRRRGPGHDWAVVRLAAEGCVQRVEIDTTNFKGNHPDSAAVELGTGDSDWRPAVPRTRLAPHARQVFDVEDSGAATHARLVIHPDGGVARLRLYGQVTDAGWERWSVGYLNALLAPTCAAELAACCASTAWAKTLVASRPWADAGSLTAAADAAWARTGPDDWREAFAAHPRIGDRAEPGAGAGWSRQEQAGAAGADGEVRAALAAGNRAYEERFGHVFLIRATGRSAAEVLAALRARMGNDPGSELRVAAEEVRQITALRLAKLLRPAE